MRHSVSALTPFALCCSVSLLSETLSTVYVRQYKVEKMARNSVDNSKYLTVLKSVVFGQMVFKSYFAKSWVTTDDSQGLRKQISFLMEFTNTIL